MRFARQSEQVPLERGIQGDDVDLSTLFIYRKFLKSQNIVYNSYEIKNGITKERRQGFAMTLIMKFFVFLVWTALVDYRERIIMSMELSIAHGLSILFKQCSFFVVNLQNQHRGFTFRTVKRVISKRKNNGITPI